MAKMIFSLGFWMTIVLFVALGYAFGRAWGSECDGSINCGSQRAAFASARAANENKSFENDLRAGDVASGIKCAPAAIAQSGDPRFQQFADLQAGAPTYAPGFSLTVSRHRPQAIICPGPIEIPRH
ncbi:hypothetical protein [Candidatus Binatus sp.]|uniref:hypothetical protein n=1 Tax=Candidatus Binatus sp. TaxID=2811406 RepID=UPI003C7598C1